MNTRLSTYCYVTEIGLRLFCTKILKVRLNFESLFTIKIEFVFLVSAGIRLMIVLLRSSLQYM